MAHIEPLSIDISGTWSRRKAQAVLDALHCELERHPFRLELLDVSTSEAPDRVLIRMKCLYHGYPIQPDSACEMCMAGVGHDVLQNRRDNR